jgi:hypothetical protein
MALAHDFNANRFNGTNLRTSVIATRFFFPLVVVAGRLISTKSAFGSTFVTIQQMRFSLYFYLYIYRRSSHFENYGRSLIMSNDELKERFHHVYVFKKSKKIKTPAPAPAPPAPDNPEPPNRVATKPPVPISINIRSLRRKCS